jgi:hypothetical protein
MTIFDKKKSKQSPYPSRGRGEKAAMKVPEKKENWQERMKIKPKLLVPPGEAFAPMDDIWEDYL